MTLSLPCRRRLSPPQGRKAARWTWSPRKEPQQRDRTRLEVRHLKPKAQDREKIMPKPAARAVQGGRKQNRIHRTDPRGQSAA